MSKAIMYSQSKGFSIHSRTVFKNSRGFMYKLSSIDHNEMILLTVITPGTPVNIEMRLVKSLGRAECLTPDGKSAFFRLDIALPLKDNRADLKGNP